MRFFLLTSFFVLAGLSVFAQNKNSIGLRLGISQPTVLARNVDHVRDGFKFTPTVGLFYRHQISAHWTLIAEFNHEERGWLRNFGPKIRYNYRLFYVALPLMAAYTWGSKIEKSVFFGPNVGHSYKGDITPGEYHNYLFQVDDRAVLDYSAIIGVGCATFLDERIKLHVDLRYHRSFNEVTPDNPGNIKTHGLIGAAGLSYQF